MSLSPALLSPVALPPEAMALALTTAATGLMWVPYVGARIITQGAMRALGCPVPSTGADWAERCHRAHVNAVENLAVFAPLVLLSVLAGISTPETVFAGWLTCGARLVHYGAYTAGIPGVRTLSFLTGWGGMAVFAIGLLTH